MNNYFKSIESQINNSKKIAFCITCMNRLDHLKQTLEMNILENYQTEHVEFILLDYNSQDGLGEWVYSNMKNYIDEGILVYYRTVEPAYYQRSHSRNMAFRLANAEILCNLDADNFLGKGFASFMLQEFATHESIFYVTNYSPDGTFGRICIRNEDFISIKGYNEALQGWGFEDNDIQNRLIEKGLKSMHFQNHEFYHYIKHSDLERISEEYLYKKLYLMYITYINPYTSEILLLYNNNVTEKYTLVNNRRLNVLIEESDINESLLSDSKRIIIEDIIRGSWKEEGDKIYIKENKKIFPFDKDTSSFDLNGKTYFSIPQNNAIKTKIIMQLTFSINYNEAVKQMKNKSEINADGFGRGVVFKNFNRTNKIILI